jgi:Aspartyl protease/PDZ domain
VRINGTGPFRVVLDTGAASAALLVTRVVRQLALPDEGRARVLGATGEILEEGVRIRRVDKMEIDGAEFGDFPAAEIPELPRGFDGLLGGALFGDCLLTIDYPARRVRVRPGALPDPDGREYLPLAPGTMLPITNLTVGPVQAAAVIDSGSEGGLSLTSAVARDLAFSHGPVDGVSAQTVGAVYRTRVGRMAGDVALGQHVFRRPVVYVTSSRERTRIGAQVLTHFAVTFDRRRNVVRFERDAPGPILFPPVRTPGFTLTTTGTGVFVDDVIPGTPTAALDIQRGDRLLAVEGRGVTELSGDGLARMVSERRTLALVLLRGERRIELTVPVVDLVP